ncbi:unnamed protein product [Prorocentrum cordatum]|uniref:C3H1-type domain-containing protein n=1 Tax=Prorocentrum cordatum TaxID=2364126 RepID=A0ABN9TTE4_9DINO|nr:unnamed protein product [Polarella glacialis]
MAPGTRPSTGAPRRGHGGGPAGPREVPGERRPPALVPNPLHAKTRLCSFFAAGACLRGAGCRFAHGSTELKALPDFTRTQLCPAVRAHGACRAPACAFAHSRAELRPRLDDRAPPAACGLGGRAPSPRRVDGRVARWRAEAPSAGPAGAPRMRGRAGGGLASLGAGALRLGGGKCSRGGSPSSTRASGPSSEGSLRSRQVSAASDGQLPECTGPGVESQGGGSGRVLWRLEVKNTFLTVVHHIPAEAGPSRSLSCPAALRHR